MENTFLEEESYNKIMDEYHEFLKKEHEEEVKHNNRIFNAIKNQLGIEYYNDIIECLDESECNGKLELVKKPNIDKPENEDWNSFNHVYVDQYCNGGYTGDEFAGYIYIPLKENLYLKSHYNM